MIGIDIVKVMLKMTDEDADRDAAVSALIEKASAFAVHYCNLPAYDSCLDGIVAQMVCEDFSKCRAAGISYKSYSGMIEMYREDYSKQVYRGLRAFRRLRAV